MLRMRRWAAVAVLLTIPVLVLAQGANYSIKVADDPLPKELNASIAKLLAPASVRFLDKQGKTVGQIWFRKDVPADATPGQIKNGLTYRELKQTEIVGAIRFEQEWTDYRKQKVKAGVYTLRLGFQPQDGDHAGSSQFTEFVVAVAAAKDTKPDLMEPKEMVEAAAKSIGTGHPGVFMLFPNNTPAAAPQLAGKDNNHWVLNVKEDVTVGGKKAGSIGIGLTLVGNAN
jgi:hypothetical protein